MEQEPMLGYENTPKGNETQTPAMKEKISKDLAPYESIEFPDEPSPYGGARRIESMNAGELPIFLHDTLKEAHKHGHLPRTLSHYIGTLDGLQLVDSGSIRGLTELRRQLIGNRRADEKVLPQILEIVDGLRPQRRK